LNSHILSPDPAVDLGGPLSPREVIALGGEKHTNLGELYIFRVFISIPKKLIAHIFFFLDLIWIDDLGVQRFFCKIKYVLVAYVKATNYDCEYIMGAEDTKYAFKNPV
jgi:hypothetical protein